MKCEHDRSGLVELARSGIHCTEPLCGACAQFFEDQRNLSALLSGCPAPVEMAEMEPWIMAEFDRFHRPRRWVIPALAALAAGLLLAVFPGHRRVPEPARPAVARTGGTVSPPPVAEVSTPRRKPLKGSRPRAAKKLDAPFLQIPYTRPLEPDERASIVRMEMPVSSLIAAGLPIAATDAGARAEADVVVGTDGLARAVRLISISSKEISDKE